MMLSNIGVTEQKIELNNSNNVQRQEDLKSLQSESERKKTYVQISQKHPV